MDYLKHALELAKLGRTSPNPRVGCVIVKDDRIIGKGYHGRYGGGHAEINALNHAEINALKSADTISGAVMYVTLEPCCHTGCTGPCTDAIIKAGIKKVVIGMPDPNPLVCGKGAECLENAGISVEMIDQNSKLAKQIKKLNEKYIKFITTGLPFVAIKAAVTLNGKITLPGKRWITNEKSREFAHQLRAEYDAILVGSGTVLTDNPLLTCRLEGMEDTHTLSKLGKNPLRVIVDTSFKAPLDSNVFNDGNFVVATTNSANKEKKEKIRQIELKYGKDKIIYSKYNYNYNNVENINNNNINSGIDIQDILSQLAKRGISSVLVEGGSKIITSFLNAKMADKFIACIAPMIGEGVDVVGKLNSTIKLKETIIKQFDEDTLIEGYVEYG